MAMPSPGTSSRSVRVPTTTTTSSSRRLNLPAGFRFHPTDEELIVHYLTKQAAGIPCPAPNIIAEVNIYQCNPWDLPAKAAAVFGESGGEWYFFSPRDRKYPNGARPNRAAGSGYWKATGTDKAILSTPTGHRVGVKKALVFYGGRPPRGLKTDWIMHEYRLADADDKNKTRRRGSSMRLDDWVLCRIHKKSNNDFQSQRSSSSSDHQEHEHEQEGSSTVDDEDSPKPELPDLEHDMFQFQYPQTTTPTTMSKSCSLTDLLNSFVDCSALSQILDDDGPLAETETLPAPQHNNPPLIYPTYQPLNYNNNNNNNSLNNNNLPRTNAAACSGSAGYVAVANNNNCNNGVKRKRMTTTPAAMDMDDAAADGSFDDGSRNGGFSTKLKTMLPVSDPRNSSSYCNQQVIVDTTSGSLLFQPYSSSSSMLMSYPFLEMQ